MLAGIGGVPCKLRFERFDEDVFMLISLNQLRDTEAMIHVKSDTIDFKNIHKFGVPLHRLPSERLALNITKVDDKTSDVEAIRGREIDVFEAESKRIGAHQKRFFPA